MESKQDLNERITLTTMKIHNNYPELVKYLDEIPEHFISMTPNGVSNKDLKDYLNSLNSLVKTYSKEC